MAFFGEDLLLNNKGQLGCYHLRDGTALIIKKSSKTCLRFQYCLTYSSSIYQHIPSILPEILPAIHLFFSSLSSYFYSFSLLVRSLLICPIFILFLIKFHWQNLDIFNYMCKAPLPFPPKNFIVKISHMHLTGRKIFIIPSHHVEIIIASNIYYLLGTLLVSAWTCAKYITYSIYFKTSQNY